MKDVLIEFLQIAARFGFNARNHIVKTLLNLFELFNVSFRAIVFIWLEDIRKNLAFSYESMKLYIGVLGHKLS